MKESYRENLASCSGLEPYAGEVYSVIHFFPRIDSRFLLPKLGRCLI